MKYKKKRGYERKIFKRKSGGGSYQLRGDARYRSAMPALSDINIKGEKIKNSDISIADMIRARLPNFRIFGK